MIKKYWPIGEGVILVALIFAGNRTLPLLFILISILLRFLCDNRERFFKGLRDD